MARSLLVAMPKVVSHLSSFAVSRRLHRSASMSELSAGAVSLSQSPEVARRRCALVAPRLDWSALPVRHIRPRPAEPLGRGALLGGRSAAGTIAQTASVHSGGRAVRTGRRFGVFAKELEGAPPVFVQSRGRRRSVRRVVATMAGRGDRAPTSPRMPVRRGGRSRAWRPTAWPWGHRAISRVLLVDPARARTPIPTLVATRRSERTRSASRARDRGAGMQTSACVSARSSLYAPGEC